MTGGKLKELINDKKVQSIDFAKFLGKSKQYVNSIFNRKEISLELTKKAAEFLKMPVNDLLDLPESEPKTRNSTGMLNEDSQEYGLPKTAAQNNTQLRYENNKLQSRLLEALEENRTLRIQINSLKENQKKK